MTLGATKTQTDLINIHFAMPANDWIILVKPNDGSRAIREIIPCQLLFTKKYVEWFRARNANGCHIYGRPNSTRYILIDDITTEALSRMKHNGLTLTAAIETSPDNFQVWITAADEDLPIQVATELAKLLAAQYGGDPGSTDAFHLGRLPGLRNKKPEYQTHPGDGGPLVILRIARTAPVIPDAINELLEKACYLAEQRTPASSSALGACAPADNLDIDPSRSPMTPIEAYEIYEAELKCQAERKGWNLPIQKGFRSDADYAVTYSLRNYYGFEPDDLAALLQYESEKAAERGMEYVIRTVSNVCHC
jgi:hypothetical protein